MDHRWPRPIALAPRAESGGAGARRGGRVREVLLREAGELPMWLLTPALAAVTSGNACRGRRRSCPSVTCRSVCDKLRSSLEIDNGFSGGVNLASPLFVKVRRSVARGH